MRISLVIFVVKLARMTELKARPLWPLLTATLIGLPLLYVASFGPLCLLADRGWLPRVVVRTAFYPLAVIAARCPPAVATLLIDYSGERAGFSATSVARETMVRAVHGVGPWR